MAQVTDPLFLPLRSKRLFEDVADEIRRVILEGRYRVGDRLPSERELAEQFRVGRSAIREALRLLEQVGVISVTVGSGGGAFVQRVDHGWISGSLADMLRFGDIALEHLTEARKGIELNILESAFRNFDAQDLQRLESNLQETRELHQRNLRATEQNMQFHLLVAKAAKNPVYIILMDTLSRVMSTYLLRLRMTEKLSDSMQCSHEAIVQALKDRDLDAARSLMLEHLEDVSRHLLKMMEAKHLSRD